MKKMTLMMLVLLSGAFFAFGQGATSCSDLNGYPQWKNTGLVGGYTLTAGSLENAAQTYYYSGPGRVTGVRIYGKTNALLGLAMAAKIYTVDANGRPATAIGTKTFTWTFLDNSNGYKDISFSGSGLAVNANFAASIEMTGGYSGITTFTISYNGDGEGRGEDLASLAGTNTGFNWASAKNTYSKNGDFYIIPKMMHYITSGFTINSACIPAATPVTFTNTTLLSRDSMFNTIGLSGYIGSDNFYTWNFGDGSAVSYATNPEHTYASAGLYTVTLKATMGGWNGACSNTYTMKISVGLNLSVASVSNATCSGAANGSVTLTATGGAAPYKYSRNGETYQSSATFSSLGAGTFTFYVKDSFNCIKTTIATVNMPASIIFNTPSTTQSSCGNANGALLVSASGGSGTIQYSLNDTTWQATGAFANLMAGNYTVRAKDANGCTNTIGVIVNDAGGPTLNINSTSQITCFGGTNGSVTVSGSGGSGTLQYNLNNGTFQSSGTFNNLGAGIYTLMVKDGNGCTDIRTVTLTEPSALVVNATSSPVLCNGGNDGKIIVTSAIGGTGTLVYSINGNTFQSSGIFNGIAAGTYTVYVKDVAGCAATTNVTVTQPTQMVVSVSSINVSCNVGSDGILTVMIAGGISPYSYSLDGTNFFPTGDFTGLAAGTYTATVKDANNCIATKVVTITQPTAITATVTTGNSTCGNANGNILVAAGGGSGSGYQYSINNTIWNSTGSFTSLVDSTYVIVVQDGSGCRNLFQSIVANVDGPSINSISKTDISCNGGNDGSVTVTNVTGGSGALTYRIDGSPWQSSNVFSGLTAGAHTVVVKDGVGCTGSASTTLTEPAAIVVYASTTNVSCYGGNNGTITVTAGGGSGTLAYSIDGITYQSNNVLTGLSAGTYQIYVRDAGGCVGSTFKTIVQPPAIIISDIGTLDVTCNGSQNGAITITASGGTGSLQYALAGSGYQLTQSFTGLSGGDYAVYVKDANNCVKTEDVVILEPEVLNLANNRYNVSCYGGNNGVIDITVIGGTYPYAYNWSNEANTEDIFNLKAGSYSVVIQDANGCTDSENFTITQPASPLIVNGVVTNVSSSAAKNGSVNITTTGGTPPYAFSWSNGNTVEDITDLSPGTYTVTITDANACMTSGVFTVSFPLSINGITNYSDIKVYPNPAAGQVTIDAGNNMIKQVELINMIGETVYKSNPDSNRLVIDISGLKSGIYFVRMYTGNKSATTRLKILN
jgi:uncharacterized protein (DUF2141 family)